MFNSITASVKSYELVFFYTCEYGIETLDGLYSWESKDPANRRLIEVESLDAAYSIIDNKKLLKTFAA